ncbi:hypothetical protein K8R43_02415, partial [archaeon]|nr:hypothetical protein [archaeon]
MPDDKLIIWYKEAREGGLSCEEVQTALQDLGYSSKEIADLVEVAEDFQEPVVPSVSPKATPTSISSYVKKEGDIIWKVVILLALLGLILAGIGVLFIRGISSNDNPWFPDDPIQVDGLPPKVSVSSDGWANLEGLSVDCVDMGIDFSSGCDNSTFAFYISSEESCPKNFSLYEQKPVTQQGFLCAVAKDVEGNIGYSQPVEAKFDVHPPKTTLEQKTEWLSVSTTLQAVDFDEGSGLDVCFYSLTSGSDIVQDWTEYSCNSKISVPVGSSGCTVQGNNSCIIKAYSQDKAGNKGQIVESALSIDFELPVAQINDVLPSVPSEEKLLVNGSISIIGTAMDDTFKEYSLELQGTTLTRSIVTSDKQSFEKELGSINTKSLSNSLYTLILTVTDFSGKNSTSILVLEVSNHETAIPCSPGDIQLCSELEGVCSSSIRECTQESRWGECNIESVPGYQITETSCDDNLDNDCDGSTDDADGDCSIDCSNE